MTHGLAPQARSRRRCTLRQRPHQWPSQRSRPRASACTLPMAVTCTVARCASAAPMPRRSAASCYRTPGWFSVAWRTWSMRPVKRCPVACGGSRPAIEAALDRYEGVGGGHYVKELVELTDGREALMYIMTSEGIAPPSEYYADVLRTGYRHFELDKNYWTAPYGIAGPKRNTTSKHLPAVEGSASRRCTEGSPGCPSELPSACCAHEPAMLKQKEKCDG